MKNSKLKYVVEITPQRCGEMFSQFGIPTTNARILTARPQEVALVVFTGGDDVTPTLYGENRHFSTCFNLRRDTYETEMFNQAYKHNIPCVGICRGAQFLCVMSGGKLVQDIGGHGGCLHDIRTNDGRVLEVNSSHHQMQLPSNDSVLLAWSEKRLSNRYMNGDDENLDCEKEIECVYYPRINAVGIQGHPEYFWGRGERDHPFVKYSQEIVQDYLFGEKAQVAAK